MFLLSDSEKSLEEKDLFNSTQSCIHKKLCDSTEPDDRDKSVALP